MPKPHFKKVKNIKTGTIHKIMHFGKMLVNGEWVRSVTYMGLDPVSGEKCYFTREMSTFKEHFEFAEKEMKLQRLQNQQKQ